MPNRLTSHHRLEACGPSNGRHKLAQRRPDFFALLRSSFSAVDALNTVYETNAVFSQFQGSAVCVFSFLSLRPFVFFFFFFYHPADGEK